MKTKPNKYNPQPKYTHKIYIHPKCMWHAIYSFLWEEDRRMQTFGMVDVTSFSYLKAVSSKLIHRSISSGETFLGDKSTWVKIGAEYRVNYVLSSGLTGY